MFAFLISSWEKTLLKKHKTLSIFVKLLQRMSTGCRKEKFMTTNFEKYAKAGFNPCTINEIKKRIEKGYYDKKCTDKTTNEKMIFQDEVLESLIAQIDRICNI
jgi:hypothetical protein